MRTSRQKDDEAALLDLIYEYAELLDRNAPDEWLELFSAEARYRVIQRTNHELGLPLYLINENRERLQHRIRGYRGEAMPPSRHLVTNVRCALTSDRDADVRASVLVLRRGELVFSGRYELTIVRESGFWRIGECLVILEGECVPENIPLPIWAEGNSYAHTGNWSRRSAQPLCGPGRLRGRAAVNFRTCLAVCRP